MTDYLDLPITQVLLKVWTHVRSRHDNDQRVLPRPIHSTDEGTIRYIVFEIYRVLACTVYGYRLYEVLQYALSMVSIIVCRIDG